MLDSANLGESYSEKEVGGRVTVFGKPMSISEYRTDYYWKLIQIAVSHYADDGHYVFVVMHAEVKKPAASELKQKFAGFSNVIFIESEDLRPRKNDQDDVNVIEYATALQLRFPKSRVKLVSNDEYKDFWASSDTNFDRLSRNAQVNFAGKLNQDGFHKSFAFLPSKAWKFEERKFKINQDWRTYKKESGPFTNVEQSSYDLQILKWQSEGRLPKQQENLSSSSSSIETTPSSASSSPRELTPRESDPSPDTPYDSDESQRENPVMEQAEQSPDSHQAQANHDEQEQPDQEEEQDEEEKAQLPKLAYEDVDDWEERAHHSY